MSKESNYFPAFPSPDNEYSGINKREYIAALALQGLLANPKLLYRAEEDNWFEVNAVAYADALLDELNWA